MYLNCHTGFSFKYGTLPVQELFNEAVRCGVRKLGLTEINNTASYLEMLRLCDKNRPQADGLNKFGAPGYALEVAVGIEFRTGDELHYIGLAHNNAGFEELNRFLSHHNRTGEKFATRAPAWWQVAVIYPFGKIEPELLLPHEYIGVARHQLNQFMLYAPRHKHEEKFVMLQPVTMLPPQQVGKKIVHRDYNAHRLLRAIGHNTLHTKLKDEQLARPDEWMMPETELEALFAQFPFLIKNTRALLNRCSIQCELGVDKNKRFFTGAQTSDLEMLRRETEKGYLARYGTDRTVWNDRIEKELQIIKNKGFTAYYLISYDLIAFAKKHGYDFVGRGSGANSTVAFCLGITNVDPIELDLYFERFLNEERTTPPDFDIDFSWDNRDAIYEYLFKRHGYEHVCLLGTHVTYQGKSIIRELGKVFGLPKEEIDALVEQRKAPQNPDHIGQKIFAFAEYIINKELPANISIHAGGVLITEKSIYAYTATEMPPKGYPVSHFEMHNAEDFGLYKFDILSQRGLGHIKETARLVKKNRGQQIDVHDFKAFKRDEKIKNLLRHGKTMGCFYVESPAMRMLLGKLRCEDYLTLVAASSIIRPGVASSGMMKAYIERFHAVRNGGTYESIHPKMDELMRETFGVMVYQEDVIKVAHHFAGLTLTEADVLRRGMSGKYRSREEFQRVRDHFFDNCKEKGYEQKITDRVWFEIESFSGYSFAKGHSASYAVESYQSLFLKAHFPLEFMVGVINNFGGFYRTEFYFHEARMGGATILAPCVNHSEHLTTITGTEVYVGFIHLKSLETKIAQSIAMERSANGPFKSLDNFLRRMPNTGLEQTRLLIRIGAFRFTGKTKQQLLWEALLFFSQMRQRPSTTADLFDTEPKSFPLPPLQQSWVDDAYDEIEMLGFPLGDPFKLISQLPGNACARDLPQLKNKQVHLTGYFVTHKPTSTKTGEFMAFGTFFDQNGHVFDTVHFPQVARQFPFRGRGFYEIKGKVTEEFGEFMIEVAWMDKVPMLSKPMDKVFNETRDEVRVGG